MKYVWSFLLLGIFLVGGGCSTPDIRSSRVQSPDTLTVLASRLFASRTYETYLDSLAHPTILRWVNASSLDSVSLQEALSQANGVLLTGGADIHPSRYHQTADTMLCGDIDVERDALEHQLLEGVHRLRLPVLGICRGLQHMNVFEGGNLHPHLPLVLGSDAHRAGTEGNSRDTLHWVSAMLDLEDMGIHVSDSSLVVSHHHQGIDRLAPELEAWATSPDGLIEGIRHGDLSSFPCYVGVQWHPERSPTEQPLVESMGRFFVTHLALQRLSRQD
ncbi:MAG: gamma-glutamyl-gamma-aminobutyrate hydrolase family protein [Flavobacteriales bacterium]